MCSFTVIIFKAVHFRSPVIILIITFHFQSFIIRQFLFCFPSPAFQFNIYLRLSSNTSTKIGDDIFVTHYFKGVKFLKKGLVTFVLASTLIGLTGCNTTTKNDLRNDVNNDLTTRNVRNNMDNRLNVQNVRDNNNLRVSNRAGRSVEKLKEVDLAHVIIRDNDAYVAVRLQNNRNQTGTTGTTGTTNITGTNTT